MAREFDGATDRIDFGSGAGVDLSGLGALTTALWIRRDAGSADREYVIQWGSSAHIIWFTATELFGMILGRATAATEQNSNAVPADGVWEAWALTWDGGTNATSIKIFRNGTETGYTGGVNGSGALLATASISLGGRTVDDLRNFDGSLADLGLWNRVLSAGEISGLARGFSPLHYSRGLLYAPSLIRNPICPISGVSGTLDGTTVLAHPRMSYPTRQYRWALPVVGGGGGLSIPIAAYHYFHHLRG